MKLEFDQVLRQKDGTQRYKDEKKERQKKLGRVINYHLIQHNITQKKLAEETGIDEKHICGYINGKKYPSAHNLITLLDHIMQKNCDKFHNECPIRMIKEAIE